MKEHTKRKDAKTKEENAVNFGRRKAVNRYQDPSAECVVPTIGMENGGISVQGTQLERDTSLRVNAKSGQALADTRWAGNPCQLPMQRENGKV